MPSLSEMRMVTSETEAVDEEGDEEDLAASKPRVYKSSSYANENFSRTEAFHLSHRDIFTDYLSPPALSQ